MSDEEPHELGDEDFSEEESEPESVEESDEGLESEEESEEEPGEEEVTFAPENVRDKKRFSPSNNRFKKISIDRLSALPDSLLIHILSFLETRKAAGTCVLSKRWQFLWTELPSLKFFNRNNAHKFFSMVQRALASRTGNNLERLSVNSYYNKTLASDVNVLFEFAVKKMVKEVDLFLCYNGDVYTLPDIVYSSSSLTRLTLARCFFNSQKPILCRSLTTLSLEIIEIHEPSIGNILSGCPVLESLRLIDCWGFNCLEINSQSVHTLEVYDWGRTRGPLLEISAPYINYLRVFGRKLMLRNIRSVLRAELDFYGFDSDDSFVQLRSYLTDLFVGLQHVKTLHLGNESIKAMSKLAMTGWQFPQSRRECLIVAARREEASISTIVALLESSPSLETLDIRGYSTDDIFWESPWHPPTRVDLNCDLLRLKTVDIYNFTSLAQILLKRATVLEKMVIKEDKFSLGQASSYLKISQTLLGFPRSSETVVLFG